MKPTPDIVIPIAGIKNESDKGIQVVIRATGMTAWLPKNQLDYLPGAVVVPVWLARKLNRRKDEYLSCVHQRDVANRPHPQGDPPRPE